MVHIGRELWRSSRLTSLFKKGCLVEYIWVSFEYHQGKKLHNLSGKCASVLRDHHHEEDFFSCSDGTSCVLICAYHWPPLRRVWFHSLDTLLSDTYTHWSGHLSLLFSRPSILSFSSQDRCSSSIIILITLFWTCSKFSMSLLFWGAQSWAYYSRWSQRWIERKYHLLQPAGNTLPNVRSRLHGSWSAWSPGLLGPSPQRCFQQVIPLALVIHGVTPSHVLDPALAFINFQDFPLYSSLQPTEILLNGITALWGIRCSSWFCIIWELAEQALLSKSLMNKLNNTGLSIDHWRTSLATGLKLDCATDYNPQSSASQSVPYPPQRPHAAPILCELACDNVIGHSV